MTPSLRRALVALAVAGFVAGLVPVVLGLNSERAAEAELLIVFGPLIGIAFLGTGLYAWFRRPENRFGALMTAVGFAWCLSGLGVADEPGVFIVGFALSSLSYGFLIHMLLAFPTGRLATRKERLLVAVAYIDTTIVQWVLVLFYDTRREEVEGPANPLLVTSDQTIGDAILGLQGVIGLVGLTATVLLLAVRWRGATVSQRRMLAPVLAAGCAVMGLGAVSLLGSLHRIPNAVEDAADIAGLVAFASIPFAFLTGLLRTRLSRAGAVSELVTRLSEGPRGLRDALAEALSDPGLTLAYWLPRREQWVNAEGQPVELPAPGAARVATIVERGGERLAAIVHTATLQNERELVEAVGAAASLSLENERLDAEVRAKVEELRDSRQRAVVAGLRERRRLERDLHDGAQQRLVSLAIGLRMARVKLRDDPDGADALLDSAAGELNAALAELRELARGIHPAVLSDRGLRPALDALAERSTVPVEVGSTPEERLPEAVEAAAYFVAAEALTNVAKYAQASRATVAVARENGHVLVEVTDDGVGGADPERGSGLRGLRDRLEALDGRLDVASPAGQGTTVRADIPCG